MNVTIVSPTAQSNLRVFPADVSTPTTSNLNWLPGQSPTPNKVDVKLSPAGKIKLYNHAGTVDVLADVVGYYTNSTLKELSARVAALEAAEPFSVSSYNGQVVNLISTPISVLNLTVTAPVDGQVTLNYSTYTGNSDKAGRTVCAPYRSTEIPSSIGPTDEGVGFWKMSVAIFGTEGSVSGTASFDIAAGSTVTYSLACYEFSGDAGFVQGKSMTAIFTPTP